jgi:hypothetical protein
MVFSTCITFGWWSRDHNRHICCSRNAVDINSEILLTKRLTSFFAKCFLGGSPCQEDALLYPPMSIILWCRSAADVS